MRRCSMHLGPGVGLQPSDALRQRYPISRHRLLSSGPHKSGIAFDVGWSRSAVFFAVIMIQLRTERRIRPASDLECRTLVFGIDKRF